MKVLLTNMMMLAEEARFVRLLEAEGLTVKIMRPEQFFDETQCLQMVGDIDGWLAGDDQITASVMDAALPRLKVISKWGTGLDSIDLGAASDRGIAVFNTPAAFKDAVAEVALAFMLELARGVVRSDAKIRAGHWPKNASAGLVGKRLGLVGFGAIGQGIARRAAGFDMEVSFCDPYFSGDPGHFVQESALSDMLSTVDYLCLACNLSPENFHLIGDKELNLMMAGSYVINVARGPLIDEAALARALAAGHIGGAGLDVFEQEPLPQFSPLRSLENVILGSHNANNVSSVVEHVHQNTLNNLFEGLKVD